MPGLCFDNEKFKADICKCHFSFTDLEGFKNIICVFDKRSPIKRAYIRANEDHL